MKPTYYLTTPIFYVNGAPHIGHAYTMIAADVLARWKRLSGYEVFFLTGTDEHGQKVEKAAADAGKDPQEFTDEISAIFADIAKQMNVSYDQFIRTTEPRHKATAQALWKKLADDGHIYLGGYEGWYSVRDETFYDESELVKNAAGEKVAPTGAPVEYVTEPSYFFRLSNYGQALIDHIEANPDFIGPRERRNEVLGFLRSPEGLKDLSISRTSFRWGIPVPGDEAHVMYVWIDALTNYITACGYPDFAGHDKGRFWPADLHLVGKDILRFHAVIWPAMLMAAGIALPKRVFAHGWWTVEGEKMSKSVGNVIDPRELAETFGVDPLRFFLLRETTFGSDGDYSRAALIRRLNVELANDLGNLAQRTLSFVAKNAGGVVPRRGAKTAEDLALAAQRDALAATVGAMIDRQAFHEALEAIWVVVRAGNAYIDQQAPWTLRKTDAVRMEAVLANLLDLLRTLSTLLSPFMPESMSKMLDQLGVPADARDIASLASLLPEGMVLPAPAGVFPRFVEAA
jgi:methionyl-tRNA synthetase